MRKILLQLLKDTTFEYLFEFWTIFVLKPSICNSVLDIILLTQNECWTLIKSVSHFLMLKDMN